ncbi:SEC14-like protein 2 [Parasteatoda tepidariorum]|uniref:SEC14-like protein 2 n=1 Tax=Parasteatoda tepidariorum TaxID=114398 RepID=UPI00077FBA4F|nr:SEC14-like protein 2 [Parasteatoda tepidariorum]XP_042911111.1 SEC14-like protein 2 [Parasteatoda tepidariorum]
MIEIEDVTEDERKAIEKLRRRIEHELTPALLEDKSLYYRFLKARDFNITNAEALIRKHMLLREKYKIDKFVLKDYEPLAILNEYYPSGFMCYDKEGAVVRYCDVGNMDMKGLFSMFTFEQVAQHAISCLQSDVDRLTEQSKKLGKPVAQFTWIANIENLNLFSVTYKRAIQYICEGCLLYQDLFPERVKAFYIINGSAYFSIAFSIIKPVISNGVIQKIQFLGKDECKDKLLEIIDADVLPAFLGGTRTDPDGNPLCTSFIKHGKKIPEELYLKQRSLISENGVKKLIVKRSSFSEVMLLVDEPSTFIEWEFETASRSIGFGLFFKNESNPCTEIEELIELQRFEAAVETGIYKCQKTGTYIIVFDNSYSWLYSKELYYRIRLRMPNEESSSLT